MTTVSDAQDQQQRIQDLTHDRINTEPVQTIAGRYGLTARRVSGLFAIATVTGGCSGPSARQLVESAARWARGSAAAAMRGLHRDLPVTSSRPRQQFGDGTTVKITMQTWHSSRALLTGPPRVVHGVAVADVDRRERTAQWSLDPAAPVLYRHRGSSVGRITAAEVDGVTADLRVWVTLSDPALIEAALYRELSCSPGLHRDSAMDRGFSVADQEWTRTWTSARVVELSLVPFGAQALGGVDVSLVAGAPADLAADWASPSIRSWDEPRAARADRHLYRTTAGPGGITVQHRDFPGLPPLRVS